MGLMNPQKERDMCSRYNKGCFKWDMGHPVMKKIYTRRETSRQLQQLSLSLSLYIYIYIIIIIIIIGSTALGGPWPPLEIS